MSSADGRLIDLSQTDREWSRNIIRSPEVRDPNALHEVFAFGSSKKHMSQRQLGRLEPTPSLQYRAYEVMRTMPVMST